jgi:hypothetical protein
MACRICDDGRGGAKMMIFWTGTRSTILFQRLTRMERISMLPQLRDASE